jgi:hypothetical protein
MDVVGMTAITASASIAMTTNRVTAKSIDINVTMIAIEQ